MSTIIDGKKIADKRLEILKEKIDEEGVYPRLATVIVGNDPASQMYVRMKHKACEKVGIGSVGIELPADASTKIVIDQVTTAEQGPGYQRDPRPASPAATGRDRKGSRNRSCPAKDVDGYHPFNLGLLFSGKPRFVPCTPKGIMTLLAEYKIPVAGARAVVVGRSIDVGRPMSALLTNADATVTLCHSRTKDLAEEMRRADILVSAVGKAHFITAGDGKARCGSYRCRYQPAGRETRRRRGF